MNNLFPPQSWNSLSTAVEDAEQQLAISFLGALPTQEQQYFLEYYFSIKQLGTSAQMQVLDIGKKKKRKKTKTPKPKQPNPENPRTSQQPHTKC